MLMLLSLPIAVLDYINGVKISQEVLEARREKCSSCDFKSKTKISYCKSCKCVLEGGLGKLKAPREKCPEGFWDE